MIFLPKNDKISRLLMTISQSKLVQIFKIHKYSDSGSINLAYYRPYRMCLKNKRGKVISDTKVSDKYYCSLINCFILIIEIIYDPILIQKSIKFHLIILSLRFTTWPINYQSTENSARNTGKHREKLIFESLL